MKTLAKLLLALTALAALVIMLYALTSNLLIDVSVDVIPVSQNPELLAAVKSDVAQGYYGGVTLPDEKTACYFSTVTFTLKSLSPLAAEWITLTPIALDGDLLTCEAAAGPDDLAPFGTGTLSYTVLTTNDLPLRGGRVEYYIFGRYHEKIAEYML